MNFAAVAQWLSWGCGEGPAMTLCSASHIQLKRLNTHRVPRTNQKTLKAYNRVLTLPPALQGPWQQSAHILGLVNSLQNTTGIQQHSTCHRTCFGGLFLLWRNHFPTALDNSHSAPFHCSIRGTAVLAKYTHGPHERWTYLTGSRQLCPL
jgi:hypothetical protein